MLDRQQFGSLRWLYSFPQISKRNKGSLLCYFKKYIVSVTKPTATNKKTKLAYFFLCICLCIFLYLAKNTAKHSHQTAPLSSKKNYFPNVLPWPKLIYLEEYSTKGSIFFFFSQRNKEQEEPHPYPQ